MKSDDKNIIEFLRIPKILRSRHQGLERFNLFTVLRGSRDEVRLHSRFLAELLNPKGSHNLGDLFLHAFVTSIFSEVEFDTKSAFVEKEWNDIDIFIRNRSGQAIIIENKIDAGDQENQLNRYYRATVGLEYKAENIHIVYLTPKGNKAKSQSIKGIPKSILDNNYHCISYKHDIKSWLSDCKKEAVDIPHLRESIGQYIDLLSDLTHTNQSEKFMEELLQWFEKELRHDNPVELIDALVNAKDNFHANRLFKLKNTIETKLSSALKNDYFLNEQDSTRKLDCCKNFIEGNESFDIWLYPVNGQKGLEVGFIANQGTGWFTVWCEKKKHIDIYNRAQAILLKDAPSYGRSKNLYSAGWKYLSNPIILFESTDDTLKLLSDDNFVESLAEQISSELVQLVKIINSDDELKSLVNELS